MSWLSVNCTAQQCQNELYYITIGMRDDFFSSIHQTDLFAFGLTTPFCVA